MTVVTGLLGREDQLFCRKLSHKGPFLKQAFTHGRAVERKAVAEVDVGDVYETLLYLHAS